MPVRPDGGISYHPYLKRLDFYAAAQDLGADFAAGRKTADEVNTWFQCLGLLNRIDAETISTALAKFRDGAGDPNLIFAVKDGIPYLPEGQPPVLKANVVPRRA